MNRFTFETRHTPMAARAFVATEAAAITVVALVFIGILLATTGESRRLGMLNRDLANLRQIGAWTFAFANDNEDLFPTFTWKVGHQNSQFPDLNNSTTNVGAGADQAVDILRRLTGRSSSDPTMIPRLTGWIPHMMYSHLVLADYLDRPLPDITFVSTGDEHRLNWLDDPTNKHDKGFWQPFQNPESGTVEPRNYHWPYSASFETPPAWIHEGLEGDRLSQSSHNSYSVPSTVVFGDRTLATVAFPAQKVMSHDSGAWHFSKHSQYFANKTSRVAILMGDGGALARATEDSNVGWIPTSQTANRPIVFSYSPRSWEPPTTNTSGGAARYSGNYRWTRGGLKGRDFDGPEINTGQKR